MADSFLQSFALPLLRGHDVIIGRPLGLLGAEALQRQALSSAANDSPLAELSVACAQRLLAMGILPPILPTLSSDPDALLLLAAVHDLLFLARPEALRLAPALRSGLLREVMTCADRAALLPAWTADPKTPPADVAPGEDFAEDATVLHRHALIEPLFRLKRIDFRRNSWFDETVQRGIHRKQAASVAAQDGALLEALCWTELPLVVDGQGADALRRVLTGSPLSALWYPRLLEATQHAALALDLRQHAPLLRRPRLARALCRHYLSLGIPTVAAALSGPLLALVQHTVADPTTRPDLISWLCLVSHVHWLAFIAIDDGGTTGAPALEVQDESAPWFALFACLFDRAPALAQPPDVTPDRGLLDRGLLERGLLERARAHASRCQAAVPQALMQSLHRLLTAALGTPAQ